MKLNDVLNDKELNKYVECVINKAYKHYCCEKYYKYDDFKQEVYVYIIEVLPKFDNSLSSVKSYLYSCIFHKALNLMRYKTCKQRGHGYVTVSTDISYMESNGKTESNTLLDTIIDTSIDIENEVIEKNCSESELINYLLEKHKGEKYFETIILLLAQGYSRVKISKLLNKSRTVVDKRVFKLIEDINTFYGRDKLCV